MESKFTMEEKEKSTFLEEKKEETLVKNAFSTDFSKNFDSVNEFQKQRQVLMREVPIETQIQNFSAQRKLDLFKKEQVLESSSKKEEFNQTKNDLQQTESKNLTTQNILTTPNYDQIKVNETGIKFSIKDKKKKKFRLKLITVVYAIILALSAGWITYNAVELTKTNYQIVQYLVKIDQLDTANQVENGDGTVITSIVEVETRELSEPTKTQPQTNWFDRLCNFFSNIFGG